MRYKKLGNTDLHISEITIGTWAMGGLGYGSIERQDCIDAIQAMIESGVNHIDTAWIYGLGHSDEVVGEAIKGIRDKVYITTKAGFRNPADPTKPNFPDCSPEWLNECLEKSLKALGTDYVDEFLIHVPDRTVPFEKQAECINKWIKEGKVRYAGVSNFGIEDMEEMSKYLDITTNQIGYNMVDRSQEKVLKWCQEHEIGTMTHSSLASGLLTGAIRTLPNLPADDVRNLYQYPHFKEPMFSNVMKVVDVLDTIAKEHNVPIAQVSLNWSTQKDFITTALCGVRNVNEALENCKFTEWSLSNKEIKIIDDAIKKYLG